MVQLLKGAIHSVSVNLTPKVVFAYRVRCPSTDFLIS